MGAGLRLALLMRTAILGSTPPNTVPGWSGKPQPRKKCPVCGTKSDEKSGELYWCEDCGKWFRPPMTAAEHGAS